MLDDDDCPLLFDDDDDDDNDDDDLFACGCYRSKVALVRFFRMWCLPIRRACRPTTHPARTLSSLTTARTPSLLCLVVLLWSSPPHHHHANMASQPDRLPPEVSAANASGGQTEWPPLDHSRSALGPRGRRKLHRPTQGPYQPPTTEAEVRRLTLDVDSLTVNPECAMGQDAGIPLAEARRQATGPPPHRIPSHVEPPSSTQLSAATTAAPHSTAASTAATASRPLHPTSINTSCVSAPHESLPRRLHPPRTARPSHTSHHRHQPAHPSANRISRTRARHARPTTLWTHFTDATLHRFCLTDTTHEHRSRTTATTTPPPTHTNQHATQLYTRTASYQPPQRRPPRTLSTLLAGPAVAPHPDTTT